MKGFVLLFLFVGLVCIGAMDVDAGEINPIQKPSCVQKCPLPSPVQKCPTQKPSCVQKCPPMCKCATCVPVKYRMTLHSRLRLRRATRKATCGAATIEACYVVPQATVRVQAPGVAVCVGGCCR